VAVECWKQRKKSIVDENMVAVVEEKLKKYKEINSKLHNELDECNRIRYQQKQNYFSAVADIDRIESKCSELAKKLHDLEAIKKYHLRMIAQQKVKLNELEVQNQQIHATL
jgi:hypothetical protein